MDMKPPKKVKDIQKLTGCMAALNRFISRLGEKGLPFSNYGKRQEILNGQKRQKKHSKS